MLRVPLYAVNPFFCGEKDQVVELYTRRWGVELFYRHLKQTFRRRKPLSTSAENARLEIAWSLVGLGAMAWYALVEAAKHEIPASASH